MTQEQLEALSIIELKAMVYDRLIQAEGCQSDIQTLNQVLAKKSQPVELPKPEVVKAGNKKKAG